ncbi:MAG TPA: hypothetical protein VGO55_15010 [Allosphingosinicella sp.]|jgi:hypothetical protein|nr:hypothetical protein [Allosphingosinicella sp.]
MRSTLLLLCCLLPAAAAPASQTFNRDGTGWAVIGEVADGEANCFLSARAPSGAVLRSAMRVEDRRMYFSFASRAWHDFRGGRREAMTASLDAQSHAVEAMGLYSADGNGFIFARNPGEAGFGPGLMRAARLTIRRGNREIVALPLAPLRDGWRALAECGNAMSDGPDLDPFAGGG